MVSPPRCFPSRLRWGCRGRWLPGAYGSSVSPHGVPCHGVRGAGSGLADRLLLKPRSHGVRPGHTPVGTNLCTIPRVVTLWGEQGNGSCHLLPCRGCLWFGLIFI